MRLLFDRRHGQFCGGLDDRGRQVDHVSVHDQVMALALGLAPHTHHSLVERYLLPWLRDEQVPAKGVPSAFWSAYALEEMGRRGHAAECIAFIRRHWAPMAASGTTWENFSWRPGSDSISHAWSAHPCRHLVNMLAGIRQTAPGWRAVDITPSFVPGINSAQARVPSPLGSIDVAWSRRRDGRVDVTVNLPAGVCGVLRLPGVKRSLRGPCRIHVSC